MQRIEFRRFSRHGTIIINNVRSQQLVCSPIVTFKREENIAQVTKNNDVGRMKPGEKLGESFSLRY